MSRAAGFEMSEREMAHLDRVIDQFVVIARLVQTEAVALCALRTARARQGGGDAPVGEFGIGARAQIDLARPILAAEHAQEHAGAVEEGVGAIEMRRAHAEVPGIDLVLEGDFATHGRCSPGVLVELGQFDGALAGARFDAHEVAREITDQITAGNPGRQSKAQGFAIGGNGQRDAQQMRFGAIQVERITNESGHGSDQRNTRTF